MLLDNKTAIVYGAAGAIGSAVARAYAREVADVHLAGRTEATLDTVGQRIHGEGGTAHVARVDVLDPAALERHAGAVADGGIDICFNATSNDDIQGKPLVDMPFEDFLRPVTRAVTAHFNIATAVGRHMTRRGRGVILVMAGGREAIPRLGGADVGWAALAGLCRQRRPSSGRTESASVGSSHQADPAANSTGGMKRSRRRALKACWRATNPATTRSPTSPPSPRPTGSAP